MEYLSSTCQNTALDTVVNRSRYRVPATGGEFWQGYVNNQLVLINCPIDFYADFEVIRKPKSGFVAIPQGNQLLQRAVLESQKLLKIKEAVEVVIHQSIPRGLGMASSTTEVAALVYALSRNEGLSSAEAMSITHNIVQKVDSGIDGNYLPGINLMNPLSGTKIFQLPQVPKLKMLLVNTGGGVSTREMDREKEKAVNMKMSQEIAESYQIILKGFLTGSPELIGRGATLNSLVYQNILPKPNLTKLLELVDHQRVVGLTTGHSGSVVGLLSPTYFPMTSLRIEISKIFGEKSIIGEHKVVPGGLYEY